MTDLSVIIVNYNVKYFLEQALVSLKKAARGLTVEYIVVDNASADGSVEYISQNFPWVELIANPENLGFGRANNIGLKRASGRYLLVINPDTVVGEDALRELIDYMEENPGIGVIGPKILDREGKFELSSRRGLPTPFAAFCKLSGLASLFPKSKLFAKYNLTYLDPDQPCEVDSLQGSFMLIRREVYEKTGGFDEDFFMYGEDIDWCYRISKAGWKVFYQPSAEILHYGGESTLRSNVNARKAFYEAMLLFVNKHFRKKIPLAVPLINLGIYISYVIDWLNRRLPLLRAPLADLAILNFGLFFGRILRYGGVHPPLYMTEAYVFYNIAWIGIMLLFGVYSRKKSSMVTTMIAVIAALAFIYSFTYFFKQVAYSRFVLLFTGFLTLTLIPGWRLTVLKIPKYREIKEFFKRRALLVGVDELTSRIAKNAINSADYPYKIVGFLDKGHANIGKSIEGVEIIGSIDEAGEMIRKLSVEEVIFSASSIPYNEIVKFIDSFRGKTAFKVIPESALESSNGELPFLELGFSSKPRFFKRWKNII